MHLAAINGELEVATLLLERGAELDALDKNAERPLSLACSFGRTNCAALLLDKGAAINASDKDGNTAMHWAVMNAESGVAKLEGQAACIQLLLQRGADSGAKNKARAR